MRIVGFLIRRVAAAVFTLLALIAITFIVYWALPSSPVRFIYTSQQISHYQVTHANHLLGLDRPKIVQYGSYLWHLAHGNLGGQWSGAELVNNDHLVEQPLGPIVFPALRETLSIILGGAVLVLLLSVPLGVLAGRKVGSAADRVISTGTLIGICTHPMVLGLILSLYFGAGHLDLLPAGGYCPLSRGNDPLVQCGGVHDWTLHLILPWITFALLFLALYTRMIRSSVSDTLHEDFVRTARAKGAGEVRVMRSHVLPSASLRVLTMVGMEIGTAIGICIYIESAFGMQGLGKEAVLAMGGAASNIDLPFTLAVVTLITVIVVLGNLIVDVLYAVLDPRAGRETARSRTKSLAGGIF
jgi:peptide/nickel transport system permease protein